MFPFPAPLLCKGAGGGPSPAYATNENLAEQSTSGASLNGASLTFTGDNGTDYLGVWSQEVQADSTSTDTLSDITKDGVSIFTGVPDMPIRESVSPIDYNMMGGIFRYQSSGTSTTFAATGSRGSNPATLKLRNSRISLLKLGADDHYTESLARQTTANKTLTTVATLSFTPASAGNYIVIVSCHLDQSTLVNSTIAFQLSDGTTTTTERFIQAESGRYPLMLMLFLPGISGAKSVTLKVRQGGSGSATVGVSDIRMVALREGRFANVYKTSLSASSSGTDTTYADALSQTFTPAAGDHLTVCSWVWRTTSTSISIYSQFDDGGTVVNEGIKEYVAATNAGSGGFAHRIASYAASSRTQSLQRKSETSSASATIWGAVAPDQSVSYIATFDLSGL
jgi:hypothetical protein